MDNHFGNIIWTNHAMDRMRQRGISQGDAWATWNRPDQSKKGNASGSWVYHRTFVTERIEVVAKQNEKKEWIILSVWSRSLNQSFSKPQIGREPSFWKNFVKFIRILFNK